MRPWIETNKEYPSPWDEYSAFESWLDSVLPEGVKDKIDDIGPGVLTAIYSVCCNVCDSPLAHMDSDTCWCCPSVQYVAGRKLVIHNDRGK